MCLRGDSRDDGLLAPLTDTELDMVGGSVRTAVGAGLTVLGAAGSAAATWEDAPDWFSMSGTLLL